jgi:ABC-type sulfate transport system substrate-binding protein
MPQVVTGNLNVSASATETIANGLASGSLSPGLAVSAAFAAGTGANKIQYTWTKSATATAAPVTYTLSALVDDLGRTIPLAKVHTLVIAHLGVVDAQPLTIGGAASAPWLAPFGDISDKIKIYAGGVLALSAPLATGFAVATGTSDQLKLDPGANTIPFKIHLMGE